MKANTLVAHGVSTCQGCALEILIRKILDTLGNKTAFVISPGCAALFAGTGNNTALKVPGIEGNLANTAAIATGIRAGLDLKKQKDVTVVGFSGDGGTIDIGLQALSGMFERGDRILYICYDNEAYMNTGIQASGSTPELAWTTTTPCGKACARKNILEIARAHKISYIASASVAYLNDLKQKIKKASEARGAAFIHAQIPCPTGWGFDPSFTIKIAKLAVDAGLWPLYEIVDGKFIWSKKAVNTLLLREYFQLQERFKNVSDAEIRKVEQSIKHHVFSLEKN